MQKIKCNPLGETGEVEDISECLEYLVKAKYVTGQIISPNGILRHKNKKDGLS